MANKTKKATKKRGMSTTTKVEIAAGVLTAAAAATGAGYYFYGDKHAKKHRQAASKWAKGMKQDVVKNAKKLKRLDQKAMTRLVDEAAAVYANVRTVDRKDLRAAASELKRNWETLKGEVRGDVKSAKRVVKRAGKKTAKKAVKKVVRKAVKKTAKKAAKKTKKRSR